MMTKPYRRIAVRLAAMLQVLLTVPPAAVIISSCIKEKRVPCPCRLIIRENPGVKGPGLRNICLRNEGGIFAAEELRYGNLRERPYECDVPKGMVEVCVSTASPEIRGSSAICHFTDGLPADTIRACRSLADCRSDLAYDTVRLQRQFVRVSLRIRGTGKAEDCCVQTACGGLDLFRLKGLPGRWGMAVKLEDGRSASFHIPRLYDGCRFSLFISNSEGDRLEYRLEDVLKKAGYVWEAEVLDDLSFRIDCYSGLVTVSTEPWKDGGEYNENI